jgi:hypothetical protein
VVVPVCVVSIEGAHQELSVGVVFPDHHVFQIVVSVVVSVDVLVHIFPVFGVSPLSLAPFVVLIGDGDSGRFVSVDIVEVFVVVVLVCVESIEGAHQELSVGAVFPDHHVFQIVVSVVVSVDVLVHVFPVFGVSPLSLVPFVVSVGDGDSERFMSVDSVEVSGVVVLVCVVSIEVSHQELSVGAVFPDHHVFQVVVSVVVSVDVFVHVFPVFGVFPLSLVPFIVLIGDGDSGRFVSVDIVEVFVVVLVCVESGVF